MCSGAAANYMNILWANVFLCSVSGTQAKSSKLFKIKNNKSCFPVLSIEKPLTHNFIFQPALYYMHLEKQHTPLYYKFSATL